MKRLKLVRWVVLASVAISGARASAQSQIYALPGETAGDRYGRDVRSAGDADLDGVPDLLIASESGASSRGYVNLWSGAKGTLLVAVTGPIAGEAFGYAVAGLGDVDGDARADFAVGAPLAGFKGVGRVDVYSGLDGSVLATAWGNAQGDHFGAAVAGLLDVSGDGVEDLAVGAIDDDDFGASSGSVRVISGASGATLYTLYGDATNQLFGASIAGLDDLDGDGRGEILVGAPSIVSAGSTHAGFARVFSGASGAVLRTWSGANAKDAFGRAVASAGDVNGDGFDDAIVGAPQPAGGNGYARTFSGATGLMLDNFTGAAALERFGSAVCSAADVDHDGRDDIAIGAPGADLAGNESGVVRLFSGQTGAEIGSFQGTAAGVELGAALDTAGDVNLDGAPDLLIGGMGDPANGPDSGSAKVVSTHKLKLSSSTHFVSLSSTASHDLAIDADSTCAGMRYVVLGSLSGTKPGMTFRGLSVALDHDRYTAFLLSQAGAGPVQGALGKLDANGRATASFRPPKSAPASFLAGSTFYHTFVVVDAAGKGVVASNSVPVTITL